MLTVRSEKRYKYLKNKLLVFPIHYHPSGVTVDCVAALPFLGTHANLWTHTRSFCGFVFTKAVTTLHALFRSCPLSLAVWWGEASTSTAEL